MNFKKFFGLLAIAVVASAAFVGCNKNIDGELDPSEANAVASVRQTVVISLSEDLRKAANITLSAHGLDGEEIYVDGALHSDKVEDVADFDLYSLTYPCAVKASYQFAPKSDFTPELGKEYDFSRNVIVNIDLLNKNGEVVATKPVNHKRTVKVVAEENTDWNLLLNGSGEAKVTFEKNEDGSIELVD